eukprot:55433-Eustigmatos_ZCMA.PRE.1
MVYILLLLLGGGSASGRLAASRMFGGVFSPGSRISVPGDGGELRSIASYEQVGTPTAGAPAYALARGKDAVVVPLTVRSPLLSPPVQVLACRPIDKTTESPGVINPHRRLTQSLAPLWTYWFQRRPYAPLRDRDRSIRQSSHGPQDNQFLRRFASGATPGQLRLYSVL